MRANQKILHHVLALYHHDDNEFNTQVLETVAKVIVTNSFAPITVLPTKTRAQQARVMVCVQTFPLCAIAVPHLERYNFPLKKKYLTHPTQEVDDIETWKAILAKLEGDKLHD